MSFKGILTVDEKSFNVQNMKFSLHQPVDSNGRPNARPNGGFIQISIESSKESKLFMAWMLDAEATKNGRVEFTSRDNSGILKTISFEKAYCIGYDESFEATGSSPMLVQLLISAKTIVSDEETMEKNWEGEA